MKTEFYSIFELFDTTAIEDSTITTASNQPFGNISLAKNDVDFPDYATLEEDYFILDGSKQEMPDNPSDVVYFSSEMSDKNGTFSEPPEFIIKFNSNHTSYGLTFYFVGDHPLEMTVEWYDLAGQVIDRESFKITDNVFFAQKQVENYGKIKVMFTKAKPYRYVKFRYIEYGTKVDIGKNGIPANGASLTEETDPISDKIAINKLTYKLIDEKGDLDIGNATGLHKVFQYGQGCVAKESVDGRELLLGRFFLTDYKASKSIVSMSFVDWKGILDNNRFLEGKVYNGEPAGNVIDAIMKSAGIKEYDVSADVRSIPLYGWLKNQTCRQALREVLFACGAVIETSRRMIPAIYKQDKKIKRTLKRERKFSTEAQNDKYISDVSVKYTQYALQDKVSEIAKGNYKAGTYTIELSAPAAEMTINTGAIVKQSANYVKFTVEADSDVVISGKKYDKMDLTATASIRDIEAGGARNTKSFSCSVLSADRAAVVAKDILDYYQLRLALKVRFLNDGDSAAQWAEIENAVSKYGNYTAVYEKMTTDLTGGFITTAQMRGYYKIIGNDYYLGEIYLGEDIGEI